MKILCAVQIPRVRMRLVPRSAQSPRPAAGVSIPAVVAVVGIKGDRGDPSIPADPGDITLIFDNQLI
jgi:hypothetical protein